MRVRLAIPPFVRSGSVFSLLSVCAFSAAIAIAPMRTPGSARRAAPLSRARGSKNHGEFRRTGFCSSFDETLSPCNLTRNLYVGDQFTVGFSFTNNTLDPINVPSVSKPTSLSWCTSTNVTVPSHQTRSFTVTCQGGSDGTGTVTVFADALDAEVAVNVKSLSITPKSGVANAVPNVTNRQIFLVKNLKVTPDTVDVVTSCATFSCTMQTPTPLIVPGGATVPDTIQYIAAGVGSQGTLRIIGTLRHPTTSVDTGTIAALVPLPRIPTLSLTPHNGDFRDIGLCVESCFDVTEQYSTPSYTSMDVQRSATLVYSSAQAHPMGFIQVDVSDSSSRPSQTLSLRLKQSNGSAVTFMGSLTELFFKQDSAVPTRLAGQFDATSLSTGVQLDTILVKSVWTTGVDSGVITQSQIAAPVLILNEQASPFGAGWSLSGLQRIYFPTDTTMLVVTDGAGSIVRFTRTCQACQATAPSPDYSTLIRTVDAGGVVTGYKRQYRDGTFAIFNPSGYLTKVADRFNNATQYAYDASNHIQTITDPAGKVLTFAYVSNKLSTITDPGGRVSHFSVNASGDLTAITDPSGTLTFQGTFDSGHRLTQSTDRAGGTWKVVYDFASKLASDSTPAVQATLAVNGTGALTTQRLGIKFRSLEASVLIDPATGKGTAANPAPQHVSSAVRVALFAITGDSTTVGVDRFMAPTNIVVSATLDTIQLIRDGGSRVTSTNESVRGKSLQWNAATYTGPSLTSQYDFLTNATTTYAYDGTFGLLKSASGIAQSSTYYLNSAKSWVDSSRVGLVAGDSVSRFTHDSLGRVTKVKDPKGDSLVYLYDTSPTGFKNTIGTFSGTRATDYRYDTYGRLARVVNARRDSSSVTMDLLNRVLTTVASGGATTSYAYDSLGHIRQVTDAKGQINKYHYNALGWQDTVRDASGAVDAYEYTKSGAIRAHIDRVNARTTTALDHLGRDSILTLADGRATKFSYDSAGLWAGASNAESSDTLREDNGGGNAYGVTVRGSTKYSVRAFQDARGLLRSRTLTKDADTTHLQTVTLGYDRALRLDTLSVDAHRTIFGYNTDGNMTYIKHRTAAGVLFDSISYSLTNMHGSATSRHSADSLRSFNASYTRDSLNRVTRRSQGDTTWSYTYDSHGQIASYVVAMAGDSLVCVPDPQGMDGLHCTPYGTSTVLHSAAFSYDSVGNRADGSPTYSTGNRLSSWLGYTLVYDAAGNLITKSKAGFVQHLYWNSLGQLDSVNTNSSLVSFGYDGLGRRVRKTRGRSPTAVTLTYVYDGDQIVTVDSAGTRVRTFAYYPGEDQPHSFATNTGARYYYLNDQPGGSVWGLTDSTAKIKNRYRYAPFGMLEDSLENVGNSYRFAGREYDSETRLYYDRARYYDPELARFISEDPTGQNGGVNPYSYVGNDPINRTDPTGAVSCLVGFQEYGTVTRLVSDPTVIVSITDIYFEPVYGECRGRGRTIYGYEFGPSVPDKPLTCYSLAAGQVPSESFRSWVSGAATTAKSFNDWLLGVGSTNSSYPTNSVQSQEMFGAYGLTADVGKFLDGGASGGVQSFGLAGLAASGINPTAQFVGSYQYSMNLSAGNLNITITNTTTLWSATYHPRILPPHPPTRTGWEPMGRVNQTYHLSVPCPFALGG